jgi:hypothetical protein
MAPLCENVVATQSRIRIEFNELPGLRLTLAQARRLCDVDVGTCAGALDDLLRQGFLLRMADGSFVRAGDVRPVPIAVA